MIRNLLLGRKHIPSRKEFKFAMLRGQFALIIVVLGLTYIVLDYQLGIDTFYLYYLLLVAVGVFTWWLNRHSYYQGATYFLLASLNALVFILASTDQPNSGVFFYFIPTAVICLILVRYDQRVLAFGFVSVTVLLGFVAYSYDVAIAPRPFYSEESFRMAFKINFIISLVVSCFIVFFLLKRSYESESSLLESEEKLTETTKELRRSQERFQLAIEGTRAGIYEWQFQTQEIFVSPTYKNLLGYAENELQDLSIQTYLKNLIHPMDADRLTREMGNPLLLKSPYQHELQLKTKSGEYKWFLDSGVLKLNENNEVRVIVGSIIDIHERKQAEAEINLKNLQLAKTNEELDRFVYSASHDMRAPLSSLLGLIHLSEKTDAPQELHLYMDMMKERIKTMEGFIREVTDYSRNTRLGLSVTKVMLRPLLEEIARGLAFSVDQKKVRILYQVEDDLWVTSDVSRLKVILNNLISNAYKYHDQEKTDRYIRLHAFRKEATVFVSIEDNGKGIGQEHVHRIFDMFYRASENSEGSGLGLYIVKETLQKLGGDISVTSKVNGGSTFTFSIPDQPWLE
jgi:PAS domain S-box-containing protein